MDTQHTIVRSTPEAVYRGGARADRRSSIEGGGFVCNAVHNVQGNTPIENVQAMFRAIRDSALG
ncbi:MAG: hypothetical protein V9H26_10435 [Verrucomicrobiota bacterium]